MKIVGISPSLSVRCRDVTTMGGDTSKAVGTDFEANQQRRQYDNASDDLPPIPFAKQKVVNGEVSKAVKESIFMCNFKRAFRGYLRKKPERNQLGVQFRVHQHSMRDADFLGLPKDSFKELIDQCVMKLAPDLNGEIIEFLVEKGKLKPSDPPEKKTRLAEDNLTTIFHIMANEIMTATGKKIYEKYSRGADFEASDVELSEEEKKKMADEKAARLKKAAEDRKRQAEQWQKEAAEEEAAQERRRAEVEQRQAEARRIAEAAQAGGVDI